VEHDCTRILIKRVGDSSENKSVRHNVNPNYNENFRFQIRNCFKLYLILMFQTGY